MTKPCLQIGDAMNVFILFNIGNNPVVILNQSCIDLYRLSYKIL